VRSVPDDQPQHIDCCEVCLVCLPSILMKACNSLTVLRACLTDVLEINHFSGNFQARLKTNHALGQTHSGAAYQTC
jgi:hypothetical protein